MRQRGPGAALAAGAALLWGCAGSASSPPAGGASEDAVTPIPAALARAKLAKLSPNPLQLWVVVHVRAHKTLLTSPERVRALREKMSTLRP